MRYFTSDFHLDHANVIIYCNRPFFSVGEMNEALLDAWRSQVQPGDEVFDIGDFCFNSDKALKYAAELPGIKTLISGNHDATFDKKKRNKKWVELYKKVGGYIDVRKEMNLTLKDGTNVLLNHFPYFPKEVEGVDTHQLRYPESRPVNRGQILLHGHSHCHYVKKDNMIDVGIDHTFKLYSEDEIIALIKDERKFIPSRITDFYEKKKLEEAANKNKPTYTPYKKG
jgi:calcineurin-like phosphoesterase family protein